MTSAETAPAHRRFPVALTVVVLVCEVILIALGAWQLQRHHWKAGILAHIAAVRSAPPQPIEGLLARLARGEDVEYARAVITCPGLDRAPFLEVYAMREGGAGSRLVSACRLGGGAFGSILVDRGFVADTISARPPEDPAATGPVTLVGVLRRPDPPSVFTPQRPPAGRLWYGRDTAAMAGALNVERPAPLFLAAETSTNPAWRALNPAPVPEDIPNNHFAYALTWFGLAAALAGVYLAMLFRRARGS